jgi:nitrite reductase/ring-hydroxylating ferredoxin subunit
MNPQTLRYLRDSFWHLLCHRSELTNHRDFLRIRCLEQELVVARDQGNHLVFDNICPHRGTKIFINDFGNGPISCPYHGWTYNSGKLHIPCRERFCEQDLDGLSLSLHRVEWCGDFLFAAKNPLQSLELQLGGLYDEIEAISFGVDGRHSWSSYDFMCNWMIAVENALDSLHTPYVHNQSLNRLKLSDPINTIYGVNSVARFQIKDQAIQSKLIKIERLFASYHRFGGYLSIYLFPFTMLTSTFGFTYSLQHFFPSNLPEKTNFYSRLLRGSLRGELSPHALNAYFDSITEFNKTVFEEDNDICHRIDFEHHSIFDLKRLSVDEEKIVHFRKTLQGIPTHQDGAVF